jgi:arsenate reductase
LKGRFARFWAHGEEEATMTVIIYHNPRCSKSRQTLQLLRDRDLEPTIIEYLQTPPDAATLREILRKLDLDARGLMRMKEEAYKVNGLGDEELAEDALIAAIVANPVLMERPVVLANGKAALGRPPEDVLEIL